MTTSDSWSPSEARRVLDDLGVSGLSVAEFSRQRGIPAHRANWARRKAEAIAARPRCSSPARANALNSGVRALEQMPNDDLLVGKLFTSAGGTAARRLARWNRSSWTGEAIGFDSGVFALTTTEAGEIYAGGNFATATGLISQNIARAVTSCPATSQNLGGGCPSSGDSNTLTANSAWTGGTWTATGSRLPLDAAALCATGFSRINLPLDSQLQQGQAGCAPAVASIVAPAKMSNAGEATFQLQIPDLPSLFGTAFFHQMLPFERDPLGAFVSITATNTLQVSIGVL